MCEPFKVEKLRRTKEHSANIWSDADMDASCFASLRHHIGTKCYSCQPSVFRESHCHSVISYNIQALPPSRPLIDRDGDGEVNEEVFQVNEEVVQFEGRFSLLDLHASVHLSSCDARKYLPDRPRSDAGLCLR